MKRSTQLPRRGLMVALLLSLVLVPPLAAQNKGCLQGFDLSASLGADIWLASAVSDGGGLPISALADGMEFRAGLEASYNQGIVYAALSADYAYGLQLGESLFRYDNGQSDLGDGFAQAGLNELAAGVEFGLNSLVRKIVVLNPDGYTGRVVGHERVPVHIGLGGGWTYAWWAIDNTNSIWKPLNGPYGQLRVVISPTAPLLFHMNFRYEYLSNDYLAFHNFAIGLGVGVSFF